MTTTFPEGVSMTAPSPLPDIKEGYPQVLGRAAAAGKERRQEQERTGGGEAPSERT